MSKRTKRHTKKSILIDENLSPSYCEILEIVFGFNAEMVARGCKDVEWIKRQKDRNPMPVYFGCDVNMSRSKVEIDALKSVGLPCIVASQGFVNLRFDEQVWRVLRDLPDMRDIIAEDQRVFILVDFKNNKYEITRYDG